MHRILIADDSELIRDFLRGLAAQYKDWTIVGEAVNGREAVQMAASLNPDLIVIDLAMPVLDGIHAAIEILKVAPSMPIILYTSHDMPHLRLEAKKAGIREVFFKTSDATLLAEEIQRLLKESGTAMPVSAAAPPLFMDASADSESTAGETASSELAAGADATPTSEEPPGAN